MTAHAPAPPPGGHHHYGLTVISDSNGNLFASGHHPKRRFFAACNRYQRELTGQPLLGHGDSWQRAAANITHTYSRSTPRLDQGDRRFELSLCEPGPGATPVTYWPAIAPTPDLRAVAYLTGSADRRLHAIGRSHVTVGDRPVQAAVGSAECGQLVTVAWHLGGFNRDTWPRWAAGMTVCPSCAWQVAVTTGQVDRELAALTPTGRELQVLTRLLPDPLIARRTCEAIIARHLDDGDDLTDIGGQTLQVLAAVAAHTPATAVPEDCAEDDRRCRHRPHHLDLDDDRWRCEFPDATTVCPTCTLTAGSWAGEWEGQFMADCYVKAPCQVLIALATHAGVAAVKQPTRHR